MTSVQEMIWRALRDDVARADRRTRRLALTTQRAETAGGVPASTLADAPLAADGGMSDGTTHLDLRWIRDGRKPGEGAASGTGVLAYYDAALDAWVGVHDHAQVQT